MSDSNIFMHIDNICGEARDPKHSQWIELEWYQQGISRHVGSSTSGGVSQAGGNSNFTDLTVGKQMDIVSATLFQAATDGRHLGTVVIQDCRQKSRLEWTLKDAIVANYAVRPPAGNDKLAEEVTLNFSKVDYKFI